MTGSIAPNRPGHHGTVVARKINYSPCFKFQKFTIRSTSLLTALLNLLKMIILRQVEIVVILLLYAINFMVRKKMKLPEASRSLPGHASIILDIR